MTIERQAGSCQTSRHHIEALLAQVLALHDAGEREVTARRAQLERIEPVYRASAENLLRYLAVRRQDIGSLQLTLAKLGLSSLSLLEAHVWASLTAVACRLSELLGEDPAQTDRSGLGFEEGRHLLDLHTESLLGQARSKQQAVPVMVTLPTEAAEDNGLVEVLLEGGMAIARINCAHDDLNTWRKMIARVRTEAERLNRPCRIQIELAGPKSRTGPIRIVGRVLKVKPKRDFRGQVLRPARLWLHLGAERSIPDRYRELPSLVLNIETRLKGRLPDPQSGRLQITDTRDRVRLGKVIDAAPDGWCVSFDRTCYIEEDTPVYWMEHGEDHTNRYRLGTLSGTPMVEERILLAPGDELILTRSAEPGRAARRDPVSGAILEPASIHCTLDAAFDAAQPGERVWLDDGLIGGIIQQNDEQTIGLVIDHASPTGSRLKAGKGINFPDTELRLDGMTLKDREDLAGLIDLVDIVALSFVHSVEGVQQLHDEMATLCQADIPGVVLKIENRRGFESLPELLLAGMRNPRLGVMVARGDLAVELGFDRLAEVQEEILWLCEAAHVPVIWATQILERMAKSGAPSRPEVTDAAMSIRAECVMLNKGPYIVEALHFLVEVLERMERNLDKRMQTLRQLRIAGGASSPQQEDASADASLRSEQKQEGCAEFVSRTIPPETRD